MADEILDLVNKKDQIIGEVWKSKANQDPRLIHREVVVIIYNNLHKVLFQKRSKLKKVNPGIWAETVAGHVGKGEKPLNAAHRELKEEVGFDTELKFFEKTLAQPSNESHFTYWYIGKFPEDARIKIEKDEVEKVSFLSPKELETLILSGETYDPIRTGGQPKDMIKEYWNKYSNN
jgi:isopentenyl-diphosphate delta-isomerase